MLDIAYIRDHQEELETAIKNKQLNPEIVQSVLEKDDQRRQLIVEVEEIRQKMNKNTDEIKTSETKRPTEAQIEKGRLLKSQLQDVEPHLKQVEEEFKDLMYQVANPPAKDVPVGKMKSKMKWSDKLAKLKN